MNNDNNTTQTIYYDDDSWDEILYKGFKDEEPTPSLLATVTYDPEHESLIIKDGLLTPELLDPYRTPVGIYSDEEVRLIEVEDGGGMKVAGMDNPAYAKEIATLMKLDPNPMTLSNSRSWEAGGLKTHFTSEKSKIVFHEKRFFVEEFDSDFDLAKYMDHLIEVKNGYKESHDGEVTNHYASYPKDHTVVRKILIDNVEITGDCHGLFSYFPDLKDISNLKWLKMRNVTNLSDAFRNDVKLTNIKALADWDLSGCESTTRMFQGCLNLKNLEPLSGWNMRNVHSTDYMFCGTSIISAHGLEDWDLSGLYCMDGMFAHCHSLGEPDRIKIDGLKSKIETLQSQLDEIDGNTASFNGGAGETTAVSGDVDLGRELIARMLVETESESIARTLVETESELKSLYDGLDALEPLTKWELPHVGSMARLFAFSGKTDKVFDALFDEERPGNWILGEERSWSLDGVSNMADMFLGVKIQDSRNSCIVRNTADITSNRRVLDAALGRWLGIMW